MTAGQIIFGITLYIIVILIARKNNQGLHFESKRSKVISYFTCGLFWTVVCSIVGILLCWIFGHDMTWFAHAILWPYYLLSA